MEKIVETKQCKACNIKFDITDKDLEFYEKVSPTFEPSPNLSQKERDNWNNTFLIPTPTFCPDCRQQRRLSFRNERKLYKRKCDFSGKDIISIYSPDKQYKVYDQDVWWSDKWDAMDYGKDFDFNISFFKQFDDLMKEVPKIGIINKGSENCSYTNLSFSNKDCYLIVSSSDSVNCHYGIRTYYCNNVLDFLYSYECNNCYEIVDSKNCYQCFFIINSINCKDSYYLDNCKNCNNCFLCSNLINKEYFFKNKKYSKKEYLSKIKNILLNNIDYHNEFNNCLNILNSDNCIGDYIENSKNVFYGFNIKGTEYSKYAYDVTQPISNSYDISFMLGASFNYEIISGVKLNKSLFMSVGWESNELYYSDNCFNSSNLFGCIGLKNKQYCILNKQYTKEEYNILVPKIIEHMKTTGEWGEFFPSSISPFGYNETVANEYFPITSPGVPTSSGITMGLPFTGEGSKTFQFSLSPVRGKMSEGQIGVFNWSTYETPFPKVDKIIPANKLPNNIDDIPDDILNWAIECEVTKKPFKIIAQELEFYRKHNLPIPRRHPDQRHLDRMKLRNPRKLFDRKCDKCGIDMKTTYAPERPEIVYCEKCYNKEVY